MIDTTVHSALQLQPIHCQLNSIIDQLYHEGFEFLSQVMVYTKFRFLNTKVKYIVNLEQSTCNYTNFQEYSSLYTHAIVACQYEVEDPYKYFIDQYTAQYYRNTYKHFVIPVNIETLASDLGILSPGFKKQRSRPKTKRIRKGAWKKKATVCSSC